MTVTASGYARSVNELYVTEPWATEALLRHFPVNGRVVWEPAAGHHHIAAVLTGHGAEVVTSDIMTYSRPHTMLFDFLKDQTQPSTLDIVTNPPFGPGNRQAAAFARRALELSAETVALLLTAKFDFGKTRRDLFADNNRFTAKIALLDRVQWFKGDQGGTEDHAWYVWTRKRPTARPALLYASREPLKFGADLFGPLQPWD